MAGQPAGSEPWLGTREQVLEELDLLATIEHALVVEYLWVECLLGHDLPPPNGAVDPRVGAAAQAAFDCAMRSMRRLRRINGSLTLAARPPQLGRATALATGGAAIEFGPLAPHRLGHLPDRESAIAGAIDARFHRLQSALASAEPPLDGDLLASVEFIVATGVDHTEALHDFHTNLARMPPEQYMRVTRDEPASGAERSLRELADRYYGLIVATIRAELANGDEFGGTLLQHAISIMDRLNELHRLLSSRGLLPAFTRPA
jgi:hypothetical protein